MSSLAPLAVSFAIGVPATSKSLGEASSLPDLAIRFYQNYISDLRSGRCRFEPSCSEYAREAIDARGLVIGSALAADRLIRCNQSAPHYHERGPGGRLLDPVERGTPCMTKAAVPSWLLPEPDYDLPLEQQGDTTICERLIEYADFADTLAAGGDCWRAQTEYERVAHIGRSRELDCWARMKAGACYFSEDDWEESAGLYSQAASLAAPGAERNEACFMIAASHFNAGRYTECSNIVGQCLFEWPGDRTSPAARGRSTELHAVTMESWLFLSGLCSMASGEWDDAAERFGEILIESQESPNADVANFLRERAEGGHRLPQRRPTAAAVFSAILPGSGQVYAAHAYDGMRHFIFNSLLGYIVYRAAEDENYAGTYLLAGIALPFYMGNVLGARKSAQEFNESKRMDYIHETIEATED